MDKYELVLDIIEHPENYTSERLDEIMSDPETREIYNLVCKTESTNSVVNQETDVKSEWEFFAVKHGIKPRRSFCCSCNRAALIATIIVTSVVAVTAGIVITKSVTEQEQKQIDGNVSAKNTIDWESDTTITKNDTLRLNMTPVLFEDEPLDKIIKALVERYGVEVRFDNNEVASLHLYYKFEPSLTLNEIIEQLNTFEQINITRNGNLLIID